ncbi:unnamed protein product [Ilex paraguariensis]|uniref:MLO-like protein n=1 Tax=Ilex paraguariensis TaxID=185542 RepID=A0ABC8T2X0_9AQUA
MTEGSPNDRQLDKTPTWAVAFVCAVMILVSILLEKAIHGIGEKVASNVLSWWGTLNWFGMEQVGGSFWFHKKNKKPLFEALEKIKGELMVLGFISLLLTFGQNYITKLCIPLKLANTMLPCPLNKKHEAPTEDKGAGEHHRRLLWNEHRILAADSLSKECKPIRGWKEWERDIIDYDYAVSNDPARFRLTKETSFVKGHTSFWTTTPVLFYVVCFFRQFFRSVRKSDYLTMRHGFISVHLAPGSKFDFQKYIKRSLEDDFKVTLAVGTKLQAIITQMAVEIQERHAVVQGIPLVQVSDRNFWFGWPKLIIYLIHLTLFQKYIKRSLEDDFKVVVGISPVLWTSAVIYLLINVNGWQALFWLSILPLMVTLAVGTKLQAIITQMAVEIQERHAVVQGIPLVQVSDRNFWFGWPKLIIYLIHLTLFQNAFEITYFFWITYEFGLYSCFHENFTLAVVRVALGIGAQFLCSYITLPLYALVTQMGSTMKQSIFDEQTSKALKNWKKSAMKKKNDGRPASAPTRTLGGSPSGSAESSPTRPNPHMSNAATHTANIIASVDIPAEHPSPDYNGLQSSNRDLLTGP